MEFVAKDSYRPLIPEGVYEAICFSYDDGFCFGKSRKLFLHCTIITPGEHHGTELFMAFNMNYQGKIAAGSKYYKTWCMVNGWKQPSRNARISPRIFLNKAFEVKVRTAKPQHNGAPMPGAFNYSVIEAILRVNTGTNSND